MQLETRKNDPALTAVLSQCGFKGSIDASVWICDGPEPQQRSFGFAWTLKTTHDQVITRSDPTDELTPELEAKLREAAEAVIRKTADPPPFRGPFLEDIRQE